MRSFLSLVLIILVVTIVALVVVLGLSLLIGWLLTLILPFTLFEGTLLALIALLAIGVLAVTLFKGISLPDQDTDSDDFDDYKEIPEERIYKTDADRTWENQYCLEMANQIYAEFQGAPTQLTSMGDKQTQELALRLAEIGIAILKTKPARATQLNISKATFKKQMQKMNQQPYGDDILDAALTGINDYIFENFNDLSQSVQSKDWKDAAPY